MQDKTNKIYNVNNIEFLKTLLDNSIDLLCTDVPYGLQDSVNALDMIFEGKNNTKGFFNKEWDVLPTIEFLTECNRILKEGAFFVTTFTARQDLNAVFITRLMQAGFDTSFAPMQWCYTQGFMKGANLAKSIDKKLGVSGEVIGDVRGGGYEAVSQTAGLDMFGGTRSSRSSPIKTVASEEAKYCNGLYSYSFKPANEPIIVAQKRYNTTSLNQHTLNWYNERKSYLDKGIKEEDLCYYTTKHSGGARVNSNALFDKALTSRFPLGDEIVTTGGRGNAKWREGWGLKPMVDEVVINQEGRCPATLLVSDNCIDVGKIKKGVIENVNNGDTQIDSGYLSRFFSLDNWTKTHLPEFYKLSKKCLELEDDVKKTGDLLFVSKPDPFIKNIGLEEDDNCQSEYGYTKLKNKNSHLTCKPIDLFCYLVNIFSHPNDIVLDPFCGSGTTCIASALINRKYIGLELSKEYYELAVKRVAGWVESKTIIDGIANGEDVKDIIQNSKIVQNKQDLKLEQETLF